MAHIIELSYLFKLGSHAKDDGLLYEFKKKTEHGINVQSMNAING